MVSSLSGRVWFGLAGISLCLSLWCTVMFHSGLVCVSIEWSGNV